MDTHERRILFGHVIRELRTKQHLSQRKFAAMIGSNQSYLWEVETGRVSVGFDFICRIADALGVPLPYLFSFEWPDEPLAVEFDSKG